MTKREEVIVQARDLLDTDTPETNPEFCRGMTALIARCTVGEGEESAEVTDKVLLEMRQPPISPESHAAMGGLHCPSCRSENLEAGDLDYRDRMA